MSEYQARKARMLELQREKEEELKRELAAKAAREKQLAKEAEELRKRQEAAAKEARRIELMRANEALNKKVEGGQKKELEYDPFAEDARPAPAVVKPSAKPTTHTNAKAAPSSSKQSVPGPSSKSYTTTNPTSRDYAKQKAQSHSPPPLGRKERAAKAFAQSAKKSAGDSLFSIRSLVESRDQPRSPSGGSGGIPINRTYSAGNLGSGSGSSSSYKGSSSIAIHGLGMSNGLKRDPNQNRLIPGKQPKSTREQLNSQAKIDGLRKLCPDRATRDRRTIEEIQRDIKAKKGGSGSVSPLPPLPSSAGKGKERSPIKHNDNPKSSTSIPKAQISSSIKPTMRPKDHSRPPKRRQSPSSSDFNSDSSSDPSPPRKKFDPYSRRSRSPPVRLNEHSSHLDIRDEIQKLFRRPGASNRPTYRDEYSDSGSDMEAGLSDVEEEERRTARIARREDELAEREEREHRLAKLKRKKEIEKKGKGK
ncbi:hypothetical protein L486_00182 [Kwoniella mangroviensis CBS 10435]|uniref:Protein SPT2 n=1 Tax=Kwoniella mangroviensis CBS 10435 TaxID=1331196 RepID=A0A1B9IYD1_9TREE|nr:hypothetical protein L486_00182 [Kwoniella mangroviensis CBS 10435]